LQHFLTGLSSPQLLAQLLGIAVVLTLAVLAVPATRRLSQRHAPALAWQQSLLEGLVRLMPALIALVLLLVMRAAYAGAGMETDALDLTMQMALGLLLIRGAVYLMGLTLGPRSWLYRWEPQVTLSLWLAFVFHLVHWFRAMQSQLDSIDLLPGDSHFTLWSLLKSLVVVTGFVLVCSLISRAIEQRVMKLSSVALSTRVGITKFSRFFLISLGLLLGINAAGVDMTALTLLTGAIGIGLGFGLQAITSNFVSGFILLLDKSIKPGDVISFTGLTGTTTENFGWVQELRGRCVVLRDRDGIDTLVPNQHLITSTVINWSYSDRKLRLKLPVRISYRDDLEMALQLLLRAVEGNTRVLQEPPPVPRLMQFSDRGMDLELRFWIADPQNGLNNVRSDVNRRIWRLFRDAGVTIPVAQHEVRLLGEPPAP
jgi:small-conductance mechanosensitive channel